MTSFSESGRGLALAEYAGELTRAGVGCVGLTNEDVWVRFERWGLQRLPAFIAPEPDSATLRALLRSSRALVATYLREPDAAHRANAWLYVCSDPDYSVEKLAPPVRRNVRRGTRELRVEPVDAAAVLADGFQAYADTRRRVGVGDGTRAAFTARFTQRGRCRGHLFLGAWHERQLAGFLSVTEVDDWAEIEGCFSSNATLGLRPNDTLMAAALTEFLVTRRRRRVSYGVSSIQAVSNAAGLHEFKTKVGFEAVPVHRAFVPHPWLRPCVNPAAQRCLAAMLRLNPHSRVLKKCEGVMAAMLGRRTLAEA